MQVFYVLLRVFADILPLIALGASVSAFVIRQDFDHAWFAYAALAACVAMVTRNWLQCDSTTITLVADKATFATIERLRRRAGLPSNVRVFQRALSVYDTLITQREDHSAEVVLRHPDGDEFLFVLEPNPNEDGAL